jgi:antitoxin component YwqK of YwqJK toxin-antitoxin module
MRILNLITAALLTSCFLTACTNHSGQKSDNGQTAIDSTTDGEKKVFYPTGQLQYLVEFKNGKANGRVREYTPDGKLYMDAIFVEGHRNGKCTHFYKNGNPFEASNFVNGEKDGVESKYYENGKLLATILYKKNKVQPGLKEYKADGTEVKDDNELIIKEIDHVAKEGKYFFQVSLKNPKPNVDYYASPQGDPDSRQKLNLSGNAGVMEIPVKSKSFIMKNMIFQAEYKTKLGNTMRLQKVYHHVAY